MEIEEEIKRFKKDWEVDFPRNTIYRKKKNAFNYILEVFYTPKYPVIALYRFCQSRLDSSEGIVYPNFIERNKGNEVASVPSWFEISEEWNISKKDMKHLYLGPLVRGSKVLVTALPKNGFFLTIWQLIGAFSTIGGAVGFITWIFS